MHWNHAPHHPLHPLSYAWRPFVCIVRYKYCRRDLSTVADILVSLTLSIYRLRSAPENILQKYCPGWIYLREAHLWSKPYCIFQNISIISTFFFQSYITKKAFYEKHKIDFFFNVVESFAIYLHADSRAETFAGFTISERENIWALRLGFS